MSRRRARVRAGLVLGLLALGTLASGCATAWSRGEQAFRARRYDEAAREFEAVVARSPSPAALTALGISRYKLGDLAGAEDVLRRALREQPERADARLYAALAALGRQEDACALDDLQLLRPRLRHPRLVATVDRALAAIREGPSDSVRRLLAASLDDAVEWAREVQEAGHAHIYTLEPAWSLYRDRYYLPVLPPP